MAAAIEFLCEAAASYVTGQLLVVDFTSLSASKIDSLVKGIERRNPVLVVAVKINTIA